MRIPRSQQTPAVPGANQLLTQGPPSQYLYYTSPAWLNLKNLWAFWPNRELGALHKFYILTQLGFWFQQVFVINIEERRKDHWQMLSHHFITIALIVGSYRYHHNAVGNLILVLFDVGDILLSVRFLEILDLIRGPVLTLLGRARNVSSTWASRMLATSALVSSC